MPVFETTRITEWGDCDPAKIVFYPNFFKWMDHTFHQLLESLDFGQHHLANEYYGLTAPLVDVGCEFKAPVSYGTKITITLTIVKVSANSIKLTYQFLEGDMIVAEGREARAFARINRGRVDKQTLPNELLEKLTALVEPG